MRKAIAASALAVVLSFGAGSAAFAQQGQGTEGSNTATTSQSSNDDSGKWGLAGLVGLLGLAGLVRRDRHTDRDRGEYKTTNKGL